MATQVQLRRGTSAENDSFTGAQGELTYDTTNKRVRIHDGGTAGGFETARADASNLKFPDGAVGTPAISFASDTNTGIYRGGTDILKFVTAGTDRLTIDAQGSLGVGVVPNTGWSNTWDVAQVGLTGSLSSIGSGSTGRTFVSDNAYNDSNSQITSWQYQIADQASQIALLDGTVEFRVATTGSADADITWNQAVTLDNSGNLLVGKTSTDFNTEGMVISPTFVNLTRDGNQPLSLNRLNSDGNILVFYRDGGTAVGSINVLDDGGGEMSIGVTAGNGGGIYFSSDTKMLPVRGGSLSDNTMDIGKANFRFKDLYLSGGVYLGGTGSANKLDDYEEGTFVVGITATTGTLGLGATTNTLSYTKIGQVVHFRGYINVNTFSGASGTVEITGFPFAVADLTKFSERPSILIGVLGSSDDGAKYGIMTATNTKITMQGFNASSLDSDVDLYLSGSYPTS